MTSSARAVGLSQEATAFPHALPPAPINGGLDVDAFKAVFRHHAAGVTVITASGTAGPVALTATSVSTLSASPPLLIFSLTSDSATAPAIIGAETVVVHLLGASNADLGRLCATSGADRFADTAAWSILATGEPVFTDVETWVRGAIAHRMEVGGSTVLIVRALEAAYPDEPGVSHPLVYHHRAWHALGEGSRLPQP